MRRDPATGDPDFFSFARDYLHVYMLRVRALSPKTIEAYRISLECFLGYLAETGHVEREHVSFDHFDRQHLKAWLACLYLPFSLHIYAFYYHSALRSVTQILMSLS